MSALVFDIETGPLSAEEVAPFEPEFEAPSNYKDADKIAAYKAEKLAEWRDKAALSAVTGRILAIGILDDCIGEFTCFASGDEAEDIAAFWRIVAPDGYGSAALVGFNSNSFDLPFLIRRSWRLGVAVPREFTQGRYLPSRCIDLLDTWRCGQREDRVSLAKLAAHLGIGAKTGSGADFAGLWSLDRAAALKYLENDLRLTRAAAQRMGILD